MEYENKSIFLVADDDDDDLVLIQDAFSELGYSDMIDLRFVRDGEELMDYLHHRNGFGDHSSSPRPDVILLDLNMPRKDGREALKEIKSDPELRKIPVVIFSSSRAEEEIDHSYELGASSFIRKPSEFEGLLKILKNIADYWFDVSLAGAPRSATVRGQAGSELEAAIGEILTSQERKGHPTLEVYFPLQASKGIYRVQVQYGDASRFLYIVDVPRKRILHKIPATQLTRLDIKH